MDKPVVSIEYARDVSLPSAPIGPRAIFRNWERRRLAYNAILVVVTLATLPFAGAVLRSSWFWIELVFGAILANVCFFAAPTLESYLDWLGRRPRWLALVLFVAGSLFASLLAIMCIVMANPAKTP